MPASALVQGARIEPEQQHDAEAGPAEIRGEEARRREDVVLVAQTVLLERLWPERGEVFVKDVGVAEGDRPDERRTVEAHVVDERELPEHRSRVCKRRRATVV